MTFNLRYMTVSYTSKDFEVMKAGKLAIWPWLSYCWYTENTLMDKPCQRFQCQCHSCMDPWSIRGLNLQSSKLEWHCFMMMSDLFEVKFTFLSHCAALNTAATAFPPSFSKPTNEIVKLCHVQSLSCFSEGAGGVQRGVRRAAWRAELRGADIQKWRQRRTPPRRRTSARDSQLYPMLY